MHKRKFLTLLVVVLINYLPALAQVKSPDGKLLAARPPMGWMTWNYFADNINEKDIREMADAMVSSGMHAAGYEYVFIDDGWQGGRDNRNHLIPDPIKFPSGIKALAEYVHSKGLKLGIYSDAAPLTCAGYTASLHFEEQDAKTFAG
jgi:alpha-galactosidase